MMNKTETKYCRICGAENLTDAVYCMKCGKKLATPGSKSAKTTGSGKKDVKTSPVNSYTIIAIAFVFAVTIILIIFRSNRMRLTEKLEAAGITSTQSTAPGSQPDSDVMNHLRDLQQALLSDPDNYDLNIQAGNSYFDIGRFESAIVHYKQALKTKSTDSNVLIDLGVSFFNVNQPDSSLYYMNRALEINPTHLQGLYNTGIVNYNIGKVDVAVSFWQKLISIHPESRESQAARQFIEQIKSQSQSG
ncbi:MAG: tetratricopeptide repeat protein [Calditrichaceae bacterium]